MTVGEEGLQEAAGDEVPFGFFRHFLTKVNEFICLVGVALQPEKNRTAE